MSKHQLPAPPAQLCETRDVSAAKAALKAFVHRLKSIPRAHRGLGAG
jgi:hypothetical protein